MKRIKIDQTLISIVENFNGNLFIERRSDFVKPLDGLKKLRESFCQNNKVLLANYVCAIEQNYNELLNCKPSGFNYWKKYFDNILNLEALPNFNSKDEVVINEIKNLCIKYNCSENELKNFAKNISEVLRYKAYRDNEYPNVINKLGWNIRTCFYCNYAGTLTIKKDTNYRTYYDLDHILPKSIYPFLAISFFNFIPSCASCNRSKSSLIVNGLNPFYEDGQTDIDLKKIFKVSTKSQIQFYTSNNPNKITLSVSDTINNVSKNEYSKIVDLETLYSSQKHIVEEILWKKKIYSPNYIKELKKISSRFYLNNNEINRVLWGSDLDEKNINDKPLAKLKYDLIINK